MFTPWESAIGALLLQVGTTSYLIQTGKIVGISSVLTAVPDVLFRNRKRDRGENGTDVITHELGLLLGLATSCYFIPWYLPDFAPSVMLNVVRLPFLERFTALDSFFTEDHALFKVVTFAAGLIGFGTKLGNGCTSGHMLSGLSRLSYRSIVATGFFCTTAMAVCYATLKQGAALACTTLLGAATECWRPDSSKFFANQSKLLTLLGAAMFVGYVALPLVSAGVDRTAREPSTGALPVMLRLLSAEFSGFVFGCGLFISGMAENLKVLRFLSMGGSFFTGDFSTFDPSLFMIILFCIVPNMFIWNRYLIPEPTSDGIPPDATLPLLHERFLLVTSTKITAKFLLGNLCFGAGWGLMGICPGPGFLNFVLTFQKGFALNAAPMTLWYLSFVLGRYVAGLV